MTEPVSPLPLGRAVGLWLTSLGLMGVVSLAFYYLGPLRDMEPWFFAAVAVLAVLAPSVTACYWPRQGAPGRLPLYLPPRRAVVVAAVCISLPLYVMSAAIIVSMGDGKAVGGMPQGLSGAAAPSTLGLTGLWLAYALLPAIAEEMLFRGLIQPALTARFGVVWGIGVTAVLFTASHMEAAGVLPRVLLGLWFGWLTWRTGSLWASTWAHAWNNTWAVLYFLVGQAWVTGHPWLLAGSAVAGLAAGVVLLWRDAPPGWLGALKLPSLSGLKPPGRRHKPREATAADVARQRLVALQARTTPDPDGNPGGGPQAEREWAEG
ncbi:MAG: CPBP family intramembrane glutamic endopeptidase [Candidatus Sericytochromatia bacterium]|nr:CPBP family intramembrane glutamic endopeptidase [Candidatus Sericytochromatia bacterium]